MIDIVIGVAAAVIATRLVASMVYGATLLDVATFAIAAFALVSVALTATWLAARPGGRAWIRSSHYEVNESDARTPLGLCPRRCCGGRSGDLGCETCSCADTQP